MVLVTALIGLSAARVAAQPVRISSVVYDSHVELTWCSEVAPGTSFLLERSVNAGAWQPVTGTSHCGALDFVGEFSADADLSYRLYRLHEGQKNELGRFSFHAQRGSDEDLIELVQRYTFRYFWDFAEPKTAMIRERKPDPRGNIVTTGGTGFGTLALIVGVQRGWITRQAAVQRLLRLAQSLARLERFHGIWAHLYDGDSEDVLPFSFYDDGGDVVESALLMQGLLTARQYFSAATRDEQQLRQQITQLWESMEWDWYTKGENVLYWHWSKHHGWKMNHPIEGYNEALIAYILAAASPTHGIDPKVYHEGWAGRNPEKFINGQTYFDTLLPLGNREEMGGPLFFAHYSFLALDPRKLRDRYANYWEQNTHHALINRAYSLTNPNAWTGYGENFWGISASDNLTDGYMAHAPGANDKGIITPTAAIASMPYTPEESMAVLRNMYRNLGKDLFGPMGFYDAVTLNPVEPPHVQVRKTYLAIDQGPILVMLENHRSGLLWDHLIRDADVLHGLDRLGFNIDVPGPVQILPPQVNAHADFQ